MPLSLTLAFSQNPMVQPLKEGTVKIKDVELNFVTVDHPGDLFYRNLKLDEFDASEMGIPWTIRVMELTDRKRWDWAKLPVFLSRGTGWTNLYVNTMSGINSLQDLKGKKICVPEYNTSMCMWLRVTLRDLFGIKPEDNVWYVGRSKDKYQGGALGVAEDKPEGINVFWLADNQTPDGALKQGEVDAAIINPHSFGPGSIDQYSGALSSNPDIRKLLPDSGSGLIDEFTKKAGVFQINHHVIVQNRILRANPWVAMELFTAFQRSREISLADAGKNPGDLQFANDDYPLGVKAMRKSFDRYIQEMLDGKVIKTRFRVEDVYYPTTLET